MSTVCVGGRKKEEGRREREREREYDQVLAQVWLQDVKSNCYHLASVQLSHRGLTGSMFCPAYEKQCHFWPLKNKQLRGNFFLFKVTHWCSFYFFTTESQTCRAQRAVTHAHSLEMSLYLHNKQFRWHQWQLPSRRILQLQEIPSTHDYGLTSLYCSRLFSTCASVFDCWVEEEEKTICDSRLRASSVWRNRSAWSHGVSLSSSSTKRSASPWINSYRDKTERT